MANEQLKAFVGRIERLEEEKKALADDIRSIYAEAKSNGFDTKALRTIIKMRKQDAKERAEQQAIVDTYMVALGMLAETPLGKSAVERATTRSRAHTRESMEDHAAVAQELADKGLISQEAADENKAIAKGIAKKFGGGETDAHAKRVADKYIARDGGAPRSKNGKRIAVGQPAS